MREIAIQFSAPMVRAILAGSKTVTRRTVKGAIPAGAVHAVFSHWHRSRPPAWCWIDEDSRPIGKTFRCPYGVVGDRLWCREAWRTTGDGGRADYMSPRDLQPSPIWYVADGAAPADELAGKFRPGMFMPRWGSRILLEVTDVRIERLQSIGARDAIAEGIPADGPENPDGIEVRDFRALWLSINGAGSWESNPYVFVVAFRRVTP